MEQSQVSPASRPQLSTHDLAVAGVFGALAIVLAFTPLGLIPVLACAAAMAFVGTRVPKLAILPSIGGLIAFLPSYSGSSAATDVFGSYNTVCYIALAIGTG